jgi:hypothetical protein
MLFMPWAESQENVGSILFPGTKSNFCAVPRFVPYGQGLATGIGGGRSGGHITTTANGAILSTLHPSAIGAFARDVSEPATAGRQVATAACFVRKVISA